MGKRCLILDVLGLCQRNLMRVTEAKRFYTLLRTGSQRSLADLRPGDYVLLRNPQTSATGVDAWQVSLIISWPWLLSLAVIIIAIYWWMNRNVLTDPALL